MAFKDLFTAPKPLIACIHLMPLPGSPRYAGTMREIYDTALAEAAIFAQYAIDGLIVENFRDAPFYPHALPAETIAALTAVTREIVRVAPVPVGVNALRNDAQAALAIATAAEADFIRVNVHMGTVVSDQGLIQGNSHATLRLRAALRSHVLIFADAGVKHATPLADRGLATEVRDLTERGLVDAIIVSGDYTGAAYEPGRCGHGSPAYDSTDSHWQRRDTGQSAAGLRPGGRTDCRKLLQDGRPGGEPGGGSSCQKVYGYAESIATCAMSTGVRQNATRGAPGGHTGVTRAGCLCWG